MRAFEDYAEQLIRDRRKRPGDDLLSALIAVEEAGTTPRASDVVASVSTTPLHIWQRPAPAGSSARPRLPTRRLMQLQGVLPILPTPL